MKNLNKIFAATAVVLFLFSCKQPTAVVEESEWTKLIDKELSQWDIFMGAPHTTTEIEGYEKFEDVTTGTPIGLNKDPKNVFSVIEENGEDVIKITGEIFAGLVTKKEYENYHLVWQIKWGEKQWAPKLGHLRNSGVLYHSVGDYTDFWNVWMTSLECEVENTNFGDYISIGDVEAKVPAVKNEEDGKYYFTPGADLVPFAWMDGYDDGRAFKPGDPEKALGEWNTMELICVGDTNLHIVNDSLVMIVIDAKTIRNGEWEPMRKGKIQLQSEAAELYYKDIRIKSIDAIDEKYLELLK